MELMQLEMFVAVVESGSVSAAAERVYRTQAAVSIAMRKLKEEFGAPIFNRPKRYTYQLTPVGEALYEYAKRMLGLRSETLAVIEGICKRHYSNTENRPNSRSASRFETRTNVCGKKAAHRVVKP